MNNKDPKEMVAEMVRLLGARETELQLNKQRIVGSTAGKIIRGKYKSQIGEDLAKKIARAYARATQMAS